MEIAKEQTVGQLVARRPSLSKVFERNGIDFCCGGGRSLEEAGRAAGLAVEQLIAELSLEPAAAEDRDWTRATVAELVEWILREHHDWLRAELPRITSLSSKTARVHGSLHRELVELDGLLDAIRQEIEPHLEKEEKILFPAALHLEEFGSILLPCHGEIATLEPPMARMESDHEALGRLLDAVAKLTDGFTAPEEACNTWRALYEAVRELDANTRRHVHLENEVLHPKIRAMENP